MSIKLSAAAKAAKDWELRQRAERKSPARYFPRVTPEPPPMPAEAEPPAIGSTICFLPAANVANMGGGDIGGVLHQPVTGTVVEINRERRWYRVRFYMGAQRVEAYECFKY